VPWGQVEKYGAAMFQCFSIINILEDPKHDELLKSFTLRKLADQELVCDADTKENNVFIVLSGELRAYLSFEGREFTVFTLEPESVFTTHSKMNVCAKKPSEILVSDIRMFQRAMRDVPELSRAIFQSMGRGLETTIHIIEGLVFLDVRQRLICFLLDTAGERGCKVEDGISITLDYNTEDIATVIGSSRQSTSLMLNELIRGGYLTRISRTQIIVRDLTKLKSLVGSNDMLPWPSR
jgi:CRP/FNR family transcriptional regulator, carbon monoxide oxidation system transcription regulator